ncbi:hypothetical protein POV27_11285 [Aureisphaera galaxeae]|uniref:hypothetical protein n=1 Tax=Aureisphaera galaxeae TaxID=1538023 RepID=UPI0023502DF3|nr:hypothetical protein [Aureisphaera galaxeae]MDC8004634.1 hypothetical protein [Aureisphaera galaxeae]
MTSEGPHNLPGAPPLLRTIESAVAKVWLYENVVITEVEQGVKINYKNTFDLLVKGVNYIDYKPWVYISHRIHPYEIDPKFFKYINLIPFLKGVAIVYPGGFDASLPLIEKEAIKRKVAVFDDLGEAYLWAQELLKKPKK